MRYSLVSRERVDLCAAPPTDQYCRTRSGVMMRPKMETNLDELIPEDRPTTPKLELAEQLRTMMCSCPEQPKPRNAEDRNDGE